jgi:hypothetical protein
VTIEFGILGLVAAEERSRAGGSVATAEETQAADHVQAALSAATYREPAANPAANPMGLEDAVEFVLALEQSGRIRRFPSETP